MEELIQLIILMGIIYGGVMIIAAVIARRASRIEREWEKITKEKRW